MEQLSDISVSNVYLYVGDAVRWDSLPEQLAERGLLLKTVAASIHTPTSFATIVSGLHPPQHGIWDFSTGLDEDGETLLSVDGHETAFANSIDEKFNENPESESILDRVLNADQRSPDVIDTIDAPFVFVERGPGGHAPYGRFQGNGWEYYRERKAADRSVFRAEYDEGVRQDIEYFLSRLEVLAERDLLEDTLVIYTSDHGELLGEGGCLGHNTPIHEKLATVPTVVIHPDVPAEESTDGVLRHVDLLPTVRGVLDDVEGRPELPGRDLTSEPLADKGPCHYNKPVLPDTVPLVDGVLSYESVWDRDGGYVFPRVGRMERALILLGKLLKSAKREYMRHHLRHVSRFYLSGVETYGTPESHRDESRAYLRDLEVPPTCASEPKEQEVAEERLRDLGYMS